MNQRSARLAVLGLVALLAIPAGTAAVDPNSRNIAMDDSVNAIAVAGNGRIAGASDDPGSSLSTPHAIVFEVFGTSVIGHVDPQECDGNPLPATDCTHDATVIAINQAGTRVIAAGHISNGRGAAVALAESSNIHRFASAPISGDGEIEGEPVAAAIDDLGETAILGTRIAGGASFDGAIHIFKWGGTPQLAHTVSIDEQLHDVAISHDGTRFIAGGDAVYRATTQSGATVRADAGGGLLGSVIDVDASAHARHWAVAGSTSGIWLLYSDTTANSNGHDYLLNEAFDVTSVAIRRDATAVAIGSDDGKVSVYKFDPSQTSLDAADVTRVRQLTGLGGEIHSLKFSDDGRYLGVVAGTTARLFYVTGTDVLPVWSDGAKAGTIGQIDLDATGDTVAVGRGTNVVVYEAEHKISATIPGARPQLAPGDTHDVTIQFRNQGNRYATLTPVGTTDDGWPVTLDPGTFTVAPDGLRSVTAEIGVPPGTAPGSHDIDLSYTLPDGTAKTATVTVNVPESRDLQLRVEGADSQSIASAAAATYRLVVENGGNVPDTTQLQATGVPPGWQVTITPETVQVPVGGSTDVTVRITAPADAAQLAQATVSVRLSKDISESVSLTATVGARFSPTVIAGGNHDIEAGATTTVFLSIRNDGNAPDSFALSLGSLPTGWDATFQNGQSTLSMPALAAAAEQSVPITVQAPLTAAPNTQVQLRLQATSVGDSTQQSSDTTVFQVVEAKDDDNGIPAGFVAPLALLGVAWARRRHAA